MAKIYQKPSITFQKLSMSSDFSAGCTYNVNFAEFACPILIPEWGETVYIENACDWSNDDIYICYHVPTAGTNVFGS